MGVYLNSKTAYTLFRNETDKPYFVDKSLILKELFPLVKEGGNYICITRPRRFGKTVMANMIASFFSKVCDARDIFGKLQIADEQEWMQYLNKYSVIHISFNDVTGQNETYQEYIRRIEKRLIKDLRNAYPHVRLEDEQYVVDVLNEIYANEDGVRFIFVLDEWDYIFHQPYVSEKDKRAYLTFLRSLLKDRPYVLLAYMTGILPIAKYSSGSELNMFSEYTMAAEERFSGYFGFTEAEVDQLIMRYKKLNTGPEKVTREGLKKWYDGYHIQSGIRLYNPRSVVMALSNNNLRNYWTSSGPYDEIFYYIKNNVAEVRDDLAVMVAGEAVPARIQEYAATSQNLKTKDEIFSAMVVYGFLSYEDGKVFIPNKELMDKFDDMVRKETSLGYVYRLAKESDRMLRATLSGDENAMGEILELIHDTEIPLLSYNSEAELTAVVNLAYLSARDTYRIEREDKAGKGFVDFIFYPETDKSADSIILELKVGSTPQEALGQIKRKKYALRFAGKLGENVRYTGRILAVGISYDKIKKKHQCKIEILNDQGLL